MLTERAILYGIAVVLIAAINLPLLALFVGRYDGDTRRRLWIHSPNQFAFLIFALPEP